jgi:hypothetical protein
MAYTPGANDAFNSGVAHQVNPGRSNASSITLGTDSGLDQTSQRWDSMTPRGVLASTVGGPDDSAYERLGRTAGGYAPGSMPQLQDQLSNGSDDNAS